MKLMASSFKKKQHNLGRERYAAVKIYHNKIQTSASCVPNVGSLACAEPQEIMTKDLTKTCFCS